MATTLSLPMLFYIEDNGYGISVPSELQTPGGNIAANLRAFTGLTLLEGDGSDPRAAAQLTRDAVASVRAQRAPVLLRLTVPRLCGHSGQDTQAYKSRDTLAAERSRDPLQKLQELLVPALMPPTRWTELAEEARRAVEHAVEDALGRALLPIRASSPRTYSSAVRTASRRAAGAGGWACASRAACRAPVSRARTRKAHASTC